MLLLISQVNLLKLQYLYIMRMWFLCFSLLFLQSVFAACDKPRLPSFSEQSQTSIKIAWKDNNASVLGYQLGYGKKGISIKDVIKSNITAQKNISLTNLISGTAYSFWIRTVCAVNDTSKWEGPFSFTTLLSNPSRCELDLDIRDNSCDAAAGEDVYLIDVNNVSAGNNILESVSLIISHSWPADLRISLENPFGKKVVLSDHNGTLTDDFGIVNNLCTKPTVFSMTACKSIKEGSPPFEGSYKPEENFSILNSENQNGLWKLRICDGALNDKGILKFIELKFSNIICQPVSDFFVGKITDNSFEVKWEQPENCKGISVSYKKKSELLFEKQLTVICSASKLNIPNLEPNTEYDFYLTSDCQLSQKSSPTCIRSVKTLCTKPSISENFDDLKLCEFACEASCILDGNFVNATSNSLNWLVNKGGTPTPFTGPEAGVFGGGNYLFIESNPQLCGPNKSIKLVSKCMKANTASIDCDFGFHYHMSGKDVGELNIKKTTNNGNDWTLLFQKQGNQSSDWIQQNINLQNKKDDYFRLQIEAKTKDGPEGDIGLDQIYMHNIIAVNDSIYYKDDDNDGYGVADKIIKLCQTNPPLGYARLKGDCNDNDSNINPSKQDIACNNIDEDCNGILELSNTQNPIVILNAFKDNESCKGKKDGKIKLTVSGGTQPLRFEWSNGAISDSIINLSLGSYKCKIFDANGCGVESPSYEVSTVSNYNLIVESIVKPTCKGVANGSIFVKHNSLFPPYHFEWSDGDTTQNIISKREGNYNLKMYDNLGCVESITNINLTSTSKLNVVNSFIKQPLCFGDSTGILQYDVIGGKAPFKFLWDDGFDKNRKEKLPNGIFSLSVTDAENCSTEIKGEIRQPGKINIQVVNFEDIRCSGASTGSIRLKTSGGVEPYNFKWSDGFPLQNRNNIKAGIYSISVYDSNGCENSMENIRIQQPDSLAYKINKIVDASCLNKADGLINLNIFGGLKPYKFYWSNNSQSEFEINNLLPINYTLTVVDNNNCKLTTDAISINNLNKKYPISVNTISQIKCPNANEGSIMASIDLAKPPLDFNWSNGKQNISLARNDTLFNLPSGSYNVTITDSESCVSISPTIVLQKIEDFNALLSTSENECNIDANAFINATMTGGNPPYNYAWSNGQSKSKIENLSNGTYNFIVLDKLGCKYISQNILISSISDIKVDIESKPTLPSKNIGELNIKVNGGKGQYKILWDNPSMLGFNPQNLAPGKYAFSISDELNCQIDSFAIVDVSNSIIESTNGFKIYPNPAYKELNIDLKSKSVSHINILAINGHKLISIDEIKNNNIISIDISTLLSGLYFIEMRSLNNLDVYKFIKE